MAHASRWEREWEGNAKWYWDGVEILAPGIINLRDREVQQQED